MNEQRTCGQFHSDSTLTIKEEKLNVILEEEAMSAITNQVQVSCIHSIKTEPRSEADLQEDLNNDVMLETESTFCSYTNMTYCSPISCVHLKNTSGPDFIKLEPATHIHQLNFKHEDSVKLELNSPDAIYCIKAEEVPGEELQHIKPEHAAHIEHSDSDTTYIKPEIATHIHQSNWKQDGVKLELNSEDAIYCIKSEPLPGEELQHIKPEHAAHIEHSDCGHESAVKVEYHCQDVTSLIKTEQDPVQCAKTEEQLVYKPEEQDHSYILKTETGWPGQHAKWQNDIDENCQEMNAARCITPKVTEKYHMLTHSDTRPYECSKCKATFKLPKHLKRHMLTHTDERPHQCSICNSAFKTSSNLKRHMLTHRNVSLHQCSMCNRAFKCSSGLEKHMLKHINVRPHQCSICNSAFKTSTYLKRHMLTHTGRPHQCSMCNRAFKCSSGLEKHMLKHRNVRPHQCGICNSAFKKSSHLKTHMLTHTRRPHQCSICNSAFKTSSQLKRHMLTHTWRPIQCSMCDRAFEHSSGLERHMLKHLNVRPHQCGICNSAFKHPCRLKRHMLTHIARPHRCSTCNRAFECSSGLERHMLKHRNVSAPVQYMQ